MWRLRIGNMQWDSAQRPRQPRSVGNLLFWSVIVAAAAVILIPLFVLSLAVVMVLVIVGISVALVMAVVRVIAQSMARLAGRSPTQPKAPLRQNVRVIPRDDDQR